MREYAPLTLALGADVRVIPSNGPAFNGDVSGHAVVKTVDGQPWGTYWVTDEWGREHDVHPDVTWERATLVENPETGELKYPWMTPDGRPVMEDGRIER